VLEKKATVLGWPKQADLRPPDDHVERSTPEALQSTTLENETGAGVLST
jgi:hypothetical protein